MTALQAFGVGLLAGFLLFMVLYAVVIWLDRK
jgi:hypothetical protein